MKFNSMPINPILCGVVACFVLSGFAALLYQTAWLRQFSLVFGTSELAVAAVLAAYMGGLSLGASIAARYVSRISRPVLFYGLLEAGIAISALAVPLLLQLARIVYVAVFGGQPEPVDASGLGQSFFYLIIAFIVLAIPTTFMGATLPLLTKYVVQTKEQIGSRVGLLYATNTLGAIGGTVVAGFVLLPLLGLNGTVWVGVAINLLVFVLAATIARAIGDHARLHPEEPEAAATKELFEVPRSRLWILPLMLLSGANSFVYEVLWTRLLGHILGGSITAFATMLAGFLSGIAIGSAIASRFAKTREQAIHLFVLVQCGIALTSILIYQLLPLALPETSGLGGNVLFAIMVLLPATIFIGATFPLAVRILAADKTDAAPASAKVYSWNTVGAIAGATLAAFFIIPLFKYEGTIKLAVLLNVFLALSCSFLIAKNGRAEKIFSAILFLAIVGFYHPKMPEEILRSSPIFPMTAGEIVFYEVGRSATVVVIEEGGSFYLRTNGLPEAAAGEIGSPPERRTQRYLSILPVLARPQTESMLVVGFGGGVALEAVPRSVSSIDVIELEPQVIQANRFYGDRRENNPLDDPRINIIVNDARSALSLTEKKYDAIVSQPSHPWTAGASHLYTREFIQLAKEHLTEDGVFLQWMNASFVDSFLLKALSASMLDVFTYARMYQVDPGTILLIGSEKPLDPERQMARTGLPLSDNVLTYLKRGIGGPEDLLVALTMDQENLERFSAGTPLITDNNNYMATVSSKVLESGNALNASSLFELTNEFDPLTNAENWIGEAFPVPLNYSYISRRFDAMGWHSRALALAERLYQEEDVQALVISALGLQRYGIREESQELLLRALELAPDNQQARFALLQPWFADLFGGIGVPESVQEELAKLEGTAADVIRGLQAIEEGDMATLLDLDAELAAVLSTDLWYATSVKLRAEWRIQLTTPGYQPRMFNEATALLDSAIAMFLDMQIYMMRIRSTYLAGDVDSALATAKSVLRLIDSRIDRLEDQPDSPSSETDRVRALRLDEIESFMREIAADHSDRESEVRLILDSIDAQKNRIHNL
jgi:spermidine synthase